MAHAEAIRVEHVSKAFNVEERSSLPIGERARHPLARHRRELRVLDDVSFDVRQGEFFGVVGRNGSGKSTLLRLLASIYRADSGRIRVAGSIAAFLDLGVGFNPQLTARDNVILSGVMMGLSRAQARARYERIIDLAGLSDYTDLQLKNYSAGMRARLGFAVMTHVDAEVLLMDEVLAVGDAEFAARCDQVLRQRHEQGSTIVLVSHSMPTVTAYCERVLMIHEGRIAAIGDPDDVARRYLEVCAQATAGTDASGAAFAARAAEVLTDPPIMVVDSWLADAEGRRVEKVAEREPLTLHAVLELVRPIDEPGFYFRIDDFLRGQTLFARRWANLGFSPEAPPIAGERVHVQATVENPLAGGRYVLMCGATRRRPDGTVEPAAPTSALRFEVTGSSANGIVALAHEVVASRESADEVSRG